MRQVNPMAKAWANAEKDYRRRERRHAFKQKYMREGKQYLDATHRFVRTFSDVDTDEVKIMTGREAKEINDKLFEQYLIAMQKNKKGRSLERWKILEKFV